jgi:HPt (histidine-containing phosphotransfer) domain-containing protein
MADLIALLRPTIADRDMFREFVEALEDQAPVIERDIASLRRTPDDQALIARLFRSLHTLKGDAAICKVELGVAICHPMESLLSRCREGEIRFSPLLAEVLLLALDRLELAIETLDAGRASEHLNLPQLVGGIEGMADAPPDEIAARAVTTIEAVTGFKPVHATAEVTPLAFPAARPADVRADLMYFRSLARKLESRSALFQGRTDRILRLALDTNGAAGSPVDATQLEAAVYMHDIGMMFAPESVWLKVGKLTDDDKRQLREHPAHAAGLLQRMPGWDVAAQIILQHHEMPDGGGYPQGLATDTLCPGAKILAIIDAFEAVMLKHSDRGQTRSLLRAIAEINACDNQFAAEWIGPFNGVIRKMLES